MQELILLTIYSGIILFVAIPWLAIAILPAFVMLMSAPFLAYLTYRNQIPLILTRAEEILKYKKAIFSHMKQWPDHVQAFSRVTGSEGKRVSLMIQFSSGKSQWNKATHGKTILAAISKMNHKLISGRPIPNGFHRSRLFENSFALRSENDFEELFPYGLRST